MKKTKMVCTIGPKSEPREVLQELLNSGMNAMRLNFSHGDHDEQGARITTINAIMQETGKVFAIVLDTKGPEIRTGDFEGGQTEFVEGQRCIITPEEIVGEIYDEHDESEDEIKELEKLDDLNYIVPADMPLDELFEALHLGKAPESSYTNVGGFLYSLAEEVPSEGEIFNWDATTYQTIDEMVQEKTVHLEFTILHVKERRILSAKLRISKDEEPSN